MNKYSMAAAKVRTMTNCLTPAGTWLVSRATPPIERERGSGERAYNELFCDKILSYPIRFSYSGI